MLASWNLETFVKVSGSKEVGDLFSPVLTLRRELPSVFTEALAAGPTPKLHAWPRNRKT
jgi:hypothetical protein